MHRAVVDIADTPYDAECWRAYLRGYKREAPQYLPALSGAIALTAGLEPHRVRALLSDDTGRGIDMIAEALAVDLEVHARALHAAGVRRQVLQGEPWALEAGGTVNDRLLALVEARGDLFEVWCGIDFSDADLAIREIDRCVEKGARGVNALLFRRRVDPLGASTHRIYAHLAARGLPLWSHCSHNLASDRTVSWNVPWHLDRIAIAHPDLVLIAGHGGWPWVLDLVAVVLRHENVYVDTSVHDPGAMASPGSGWEPLLCHITGRLRRRVLFGSAGWARGSTVARMIDGVRRLALPPAVEQAWLHDNAATLLGLTPVSPEMTPSPS